MIRITTPSRRIVAAAVAAALCVAAVATGAAASAPAGAGGGAHHLPRQLADVRQATDRFHSLGAARRAGYEPAGPCTQAPDGSGAMGYHYAKAKLLADPAVHRRKPEVLLYERRGKRMHLTGVEYMRVDADQNLATADDRPSRFGRPFDGPMLGHEPGMPIHYDLHAWVWKRNPAGTLSQWNPRVSCP